MKAIFLDRDGVVIRKAPEGEYVTSWSEVELLPGSLQAIAQFCRSGYKVFFVTNQRGIALGKISLPNLDAIHCRLTDVIRSAGGVLSGVYFCPHDYSDHCSCRKPKPGMLLMAAKQHDLLLNECWMIGDAMTDIQAGKSAGCLTALITGTTKSGQDADKPDICARSLAQATEKIVARRLVF